MDQFISNDDILQCLSDKNSFSAINCNIRSLSANYDKLVDMLTQFTSPFSVIGLTETKCRFNQDPIMNVNLPGYCFVSQPSYSNAGGVGFYIKKQHPLDYS